MVFKAAWRRLVISIALAAALKAPFAHGTQLTEPTCRKRTGGTCTSGTCFSWRNAKCSDKNKQGVQECRCKDDACSVDGECVEKGHCPKSTGVTCNIFPCSRWRHATCSPVSDHPASHEQPEIGFAVTSFLTLVVLLLGCGAYCVSQLEEGCSACSLWGLLTWLLGLATSIAAFALWLQVHQLCEAFFADHDDAGAHAQGRRLIRVPAAVVDVAIAVMHARVCVCPPGHCPVDGECVPHGDCPQIDGASSCDAYGNYSWASQGPSDGKCVCTNNMCTDGQCGLRADCAKHIKGSSCKVSKCESWRNAECKHGVCVCGSHTCPVDGECVPKGGCVRHIEGSSCLVGSCDDWRHATCENGTCVCGPGTCAVGGECVAAGGCPRHIAGEPSDWTSCLATGECQPWRNAICVRSATAASCECPEGACAVDGECVPPGGRPKYTGSTCTVAGCDAWRNAECARGYCVCKGDTYAKDGACVSPDGCLNDTGSTCALLDCDESRNAECQHGHCVCGEGTCAISGRCVPKADLAAALGSDETSSGSSEPDRLTAALLAAGVASLVTMAVVIACRRTSVASAARPLREPLL